MKRKYGNSIESILNYYNEISEELIKLQNSDEIIKEYNSKLDILKSELTKLACEIRSIRKDQADSICLLVNKELQDLEMKNAHIKFEFKELEFFAENGMDDIQILISTNLIIK